jgi:hypothetical protein
MTSKKKFSTTPEDIVAAHLGFEIAQLLVDSLVSKGIFTPADACRTFRELAAQYRKPGHPDRQEIRQKAAEALEVLAAKYNVPLSGQRH